jgi:hypothetical protein
MWISTHRSGTVRLAIDSSQITLQRHEKTRSNKNVFTGKLLQLTDESSHVRAIIDIGIPLIVLLPKPDLKDNPLAIGEDVTIYCPPNAVRIF